MRTKRNAMKTSWAALTALSLLTACSSFEKDMKVICALEERLGSKGDVEKIDSSQFLTILAALVEEDTGTDEAKALIAKLKGVKDPVEVGRIFDDAAKRAGLSSCRTRALFVAAAETNLFRDDFKLLCGEPAGALEEQLGGAETASKRVKVRKSFYAKELKSEAGKKLWKQLQDESNPAAERAKLAKKAGDQLLVGVVACSSLAELKSARSERAAAHFDNGKKLGQAEGDARDLKGALTEYEKACKLDHEQACRTAVLTRALLTAKK